jgi:hypothetical protein
VTARWAWAAIQGSQRNKHPLHQTTLEAVLRNWHRHGVWDSRPLGVPLLWAWAGAKGVAPHIVPETYTQAASNPDVSDAPEETRTNA